MFVICKSYTVTTYTQCLRVVCIEDRQNVPYSLILFWNLYWYSKRLSFMLIFFNAIQWFQATVKCSDGLLMWVLNINLTAFASTELWRELIYYEHYPNHIWQWSLVADLSRYRSDVYSQHNWITGTLIVKLWQCELLNYDSKLSEIKLKWLWKHE